MVRTKEKFRPGSYNAMVENNKAYKIRHLRSSHKAFCSLYHNAYVKFRGVGAKRVYYGKCASGE